MIFYILISITFFFFFKQTTAYDMRISHWSSDVCSSDLPERMRAVLMTLFRAVRTLAIAIRPVVPAAADKLLDQMGVAGDARDFAAPADEDWFAKLADSGFAIGQPTPIFPRDRKRVG